MNIVIVSNIPLFDLPYLVELILIYYVLICILYLYIHVSFTCIDAGINHSDFAFIRNNARYICRTPKCDGYAKVR